MNLWQFTPFAILYFIAAIISFSLSMFVWKMNDVSGKKHFRFLTLFIGIWTLGYTLMVFSANVRVQLIMIQVSYLGLICSTVFWLFFVLSYTNSDGQLTKWTKGLILVIPIITFIEVLTFRYHNFYYRSYEFIEIDNVLIFKKEYGPGFYIWVLYSYLLLIIGSVILIRGILNMPAKFRKQIIPIVIILVVIIIPNILYILNKNPIAPYDPTCLSFVIVGIIFFFIIHYDKFLNIVPVAYNLVFKSTKSGVIIINKQGLILDLNPSAERIFNSSQEEIVGTDILDLLHDYKSIYEKLLENQEVNIEKNDKHYEIITTSFKNYKKKIIGRILVFYDITKRKEALNELDAYARTVAHDLKNPMNSAIGFAEILKNNQDLSDEQQLLSEYVYEGIQKMNDIIDGLLLLARVRDNKDIDICVIKTEEIIDKVLKRLEHLITETKGTITKTDTWPDCLGYPIWIEEIWMNYISNALKYSGDPPIIQLGATELQDSVKFWVKDNGKGLTQDEVKNLFKEFSQLNSRKRNTQGHGLGLSIVKRIVNKLDGTVGVESEIGCCCTFFFTLPKVKH